MARLGTMLIDQRVSIPIVAIELAKERIIFRGEGPCPEGVTVGSRSEVMIFAPDQSLISHIPAASGGQAVVSKGRISFAQGLKFTITDRVFYD